MAKNKKMVKAILYDISISNGVMDYVHGVSVSIKEIFIPKINVCFNFENGFNCFESDCQRNSKIIENIELSLILVEKIKEHIKIKKELNKSAFDWYDCNLRTKVEEEKLDLLMKYDVVELEKTGKMEKNKNSLKLPKKRI